jgi:hypothetical protein
MRYWRQEEKPAQSVRQDRVKRTEGAAVAAIVLLGTLWFLKILGNSSWINSDCCSMSFSSQQRPGLYKSDSVIVSRAMRSRERTSLTLFTHQDVADSLGIPNLPEAIAGALASDVEYRLHQIIEVLVPLTVLLGCH